MITTETEESNLGINSTPIFFDPTLCPTTHTHTVQLHAYKHKQTALQGNQGCNLISGCWGETAARMSFSDITWDGHGQRVALWVLALLHSRGVRMAPQHGTPIRTALLPLLYTLTNCTLPKLVRITNEERPTALSGLTKNIFNPVDSLKFNLCETGRELCCFC